MEDDNGLSGSAMLSSGTGFPESALKEDTEVKLSISLLDFNSNKIL